MQDHDQPAKGEEPVEERVVRRRAAFHISRVDQDELDAGRVGSPEQAVRLPTSSAKGGRSQRRSTGADQQVLDQVPPHW